MAMANPQLTEELYKEAREIVKDSDGNNRMALKDLAAELRANGHDVSDQELKAMAKDGQTFEIDGRSRTLAHDRFGGKDRIELVFY
jgi:hypothetical protein